LSGYPKSKPTNPTGLNFKLSQSRNFLLLDCAGTNSPLTSEEITKLKPLFVGSTNWTTQELKAIQENGNQIPANLIPKDQQIKSEEHEQALKYKQASERFQQQAIVNMADALIVVVNELTMKDQRYIQNLHSEIQKSRQKKLLVVIHNYKEVDELSTLNHHMLRYCIRAYDPVIRTNTLKLPNGTVTIQTCVSHDGEITHFFLAKAGGALENTINVPTLEMIKSLLTSYTIARRPLLPKIIEEIEAQGQDFYQGVSTTRLCYYPKKEKDFLVVKFEGSPKMVAHGDFVEEYSISLRSNAFASRFDQIRVGEDLYFVIDVPGCVKQDFQPPLVDRESNQLTLKGIRIRKYYPVVKDGNKFTIQENGWEYDRNFAALVKSGRAQGRIVGKYPFPKDYSPEVLDWKVDYGVLVIKFQKIKKGPALNPLPIPWTQYF